MIRRFITWLIRPSVEAVMAERTAWAPGELEDMVGSINGALDRAGCRIPTTTNKENTMEGPTFTRREVTEYEKAQIRFDCLRLAHTHNHIGAVPKTEIERAAEMAEFVISGRTSSEAKTD